MSNKINTTVLGRTAVIFVPGRPTLINAERSAHWRTRHKLTADTRAFGRLAGLQLLASGWKPPERAAIGSTPYYPKGPMPDVGAWMPAVKAVVDGLVDAGLWPDDKPEFVGHLSFDAPVRDRGCELGLHVDITPYIDRKEAA